MSVTDSFKQTTLVITGIQFIERDDCATKSCWLQSPFTTRTFWQAKELSNLEGVEKLIRVQRHWVREFSTDVR
jgi:hypothetical protein